MSTWGRALFLLAVLLAAAVTVAASNAQRLASQPPSLGEIAARLSVWDATGEGGIFQYRASVGADAERPAFNFTRTLDVAGKQTLTTLGSWTEHRIADRYRRETAFRTELYRDYGSWEAPPTPPLMVLARTGDSYTGTADGRPFRLTLDHLERFETLSYNDRYGRAVELTFTYSGIPLPAFVDRGVKMAADLPTILIFDQRYGQRMRVSLAEMEDTVRPDELQMIFYDENDAPIDGVNFGTSLDANGFYFAWLDLNDNSLVDAADSYQFEFPGHAKWSRVYDAWAQDRLEFSFRHEGPLATFKPMTWG